MKFIKPNSVSGEILNLVDEANEKMVLVSPYCKFDKWYRLVNKLKDLKSRNILVEFYVRDGENESKEQIENIGFKALCIPNLHCKVYFNEKSAIITSMNLLLSSEINTLEIGYKTETIDEYNEVIEFYTTYLKKINTKNNFEEEKTIVTKFDWLSHLETIFSEKNIRNKIYFDEENKLSIKTKSNTYNVFIANIKNTNVLRISGILSGKEFDYINAIKAKISLKNIELELINGGTKYYDTIFGTFTEILKSYEIHNLDISESKMIVYPIIDFISKVEEIKKFCYDNRKSI